MTGRFIDHSRSAEVADERWLLTGDLPCLADGYNLRGLVGPLVQCPECGHPNDLRDPSPWRKKDLPLGVRKREHWPASAAGTAFIVAMLGLMIPIFAFTFGWLGLLVGIALEITAIVVWIKFCRDFARSARTARWAYLILIATHVATAATLSGFISVVYVAETLSDPYADRGVSLARYLCAGLPVGLLLFARIKLQLKQHDHSAHFRVDWRIYQIPTGGDDLGPKDAARSASISE